MPAVEREITITYGGYAVGGITERPVDGFTRNSIGKDIASVEFNFWISGDTAEDFVSECLAAEKAFRTPYQDLIVAFGGSQAIKLKQSDSSGLDAEPEINKEGTEGDSGRSRKYTARIEFGVPADRATMAGRRESSIDIDYSGSRRKTVTFAGVWTAIGSTDARAQYNAQAPSWMTTALSAIGGTYEKTAENVTPSTNDKTADFVTTYKEIIHNQSGSGTDDAAIVDPTMTIRRIRSAPGDSVAPSVVRLAELECRFSCAIDQDDTKDLKAKWTSVESWVVQQIKTYLGGGMFAAQSIDVDFDEHENRLTAAIRGIGTDEGTTSILESSISVRDRLKVGRKLVPAWRGNPWSYYIHSVPAELFRTVSWTWRSQGTMSEFTAAKMLHEQARNYLSKPYTVPHGAGGEWHKTEHEVGVENGSIGIMPWFIQVADASGSVTYMYAKDARRGGVKTPGATRVGATTPGSAPVVPNKPKVSDVVPTPIHWSS